MPVLSPVTEEVELSLTKQDRPSHVDTGRIVIRIPNMVGARSLFGNSTRWTGFKFAVLKYSEIDITPI